MFKHILVPVDGSDTGLAAVGKAIELAKVFDSWITLVHVIDQYPFVGIGTDYAFGQTEYITAATSNANNALQAGEDRINAAGLRCTRQVIEGHVMEDGILQAAKTAGADLIVMGSHGRHGIEKLLLGSVTQRVLSHTTLPVLVVRG
ncbi:universal stress protein UspA [Rhodoferax koreense]|uniref:Universal stress protein n=1 Tax=Rhodoferax koreensis TaxID=1842727 RepID=A0A1P8JW33_9BURK|nr:universal stress protein [Rhodoferax koreense]APW37891.1 universal stress protein UspA [Rhodoferax koreense]